jgi:MFS family permease
MYLASTAVMMAFTLGTALAPNYGAQIAFRFLSGVASSPSLSIYGGTLADLFDDKVRRAVWPVFSISPLLGPVLAPIAGGWISTSRIDWRWYESCCSLVRVYPSKRS